MVEMSFFLLPMAEINTFFPPKCIPSHLSPLPNALPLYQTHFLLSPPLSPFLLLSLSKPMHNCPCRPPPSPLPPTAVAPRQPRSIPSSPFVVALTRPPLSPPANATRSSTPTQRYICISPSYLTLLTVCVCMYLLSVAAEAPTRLCLSVYSYCMS